MAQQMLFSIFSDHQKCLEKIAQSMFCMTLCENNIIIQNLPP